MINENPVECKNSAVSRRVAIRAAQQATSVLSSLHLAALAPHAGLWGDALGAETLVMALVMIMRQGLANHIMERTHRSQCGCRVVCGIPEYLGDSAGDGLPDLLRPLRVDVRGQQQELEAHGMAPLSIGAFQRGTPRGREPQIF